MISYNLAMAITEKNLKKLECLCGLCSHTLEDECLFNQMNEQKDPNKWMLNQLKTIIREETKLSLMKELTLRNKK